MGSYFYLIHFQYMGFRYHGWQKQPEVKTVEAMVEKTVKFILDHHEFKIMGASRTDSKVSANHSAFLLTVKEPLETNRLQKDFNLNLPNDIRVTKIEEKDKHFNIIQSPRIKKYIYMFSFGQKCHPFCAPLLCSFQEDLDIELMKQGALLFEGRHDFRQYCTKPSPGTQFVRNILLSRIEGNNRFQASFFPEKSYAFHIHAKGFLRYQVRLIMGQLLRLGRRKIGLDSIEESLQKPGDQPLRHIAPSSGLILDKIEFKD